MCVWILWVVYIYIIYIRSHIVSINSPWFLVEATRCLEAEMALSEPADARAAWEISAPPVAN